MSLQIEITSSVRRIESTTVFFISLCWMFCLPWHRHQVEGTNFRRSTTRPPRPTVSGGDSLWRRESLEERVSGGDSLWRRQSLEETVSGGDSLWRRESLEETISGGDSLWRRQSLEETVSGGDSLWGRKREHGIATHIVDPTKLCYENYTCTSGMMQGCMMSAVLFNLVI